MREYSKVSPLIWRDKRFQSLATSEARLAYLYFKTCEHQNSAGAYRVPDGYASADLGWPVETWIDARKACAASGLITYDEATCELYLDGWYQDNPITNASHAKGTAKIIPHIQSDAVREAAELAFTESRDAMEQRRAAETNGNVRLMNSSLMRGVRN